MIYCYQTVRENIIKNSSEFNSATWVVIIHSFLLHFWYYVNDLNMNCWEITRSSHAFLPVSVSDCFRDFCREFVSLLWVKAICTRWRVRFPSSAEGQFTAVIPWQPFFVFLYRIKYWVACLTGSDPTGDIFWWTTIRWKQALLTKCVRASAWERGCLGRSQSTKSQRYKSHTRPGTMRPSPPSLLLLLPPWIVCAEITPTLAGNLNFHHFYSYFLLTSIPHTLDIHRIQFTAYYAPFVSTMAGRTNIL